MTSLTRPIPLQWRRSSGVRVALAHLITRTALARVPVGVRLPDGTSFTRSEPPSDAPVIELVHPDALLRRIAESPKIGIGEGYTAGDWRPGEGTDLVEVLRPFAERLRTVVPPYLTRLRRFVDRPIPSSERNSPAGSRRNIEAHYDLSNELFAAFLDETMSYSAALFDDRRPLAGQDLATAQVRKVHAMLDLADVRAGSRVLEIGTGWGTLAIEAARRGARVTTVTLSTEQAELAQRRVAAAGSADRVDIRVQDYREVTGSYDAILSVEMIEAVGEEYWPTYFGALDELLAPGGVVALQAILMDHDRYRATRRSYGWIQKHIFPGGMIPSLRAIETIAQRHTGLRVDRADAFGEHYAETLRRWRRAFDDSWPQIAALGFDETFRRTWEFYLAYCEAGFDTGYLDVARIRLSRGGRGERW
ncbi:SAM-dependent methyltransferase [Nocardioides insulae]|uniref:SAM-dependent methyltransferase n=1 Tax=Nocardioides insulae TaxID=394734 RepID=UPI0003F7ED86|nr:cyclopropane-fatty-acyl-phospholipid synthase family protein [Nocardioides insulae]